MARKGLIALGGAAVGIGAGLVAQRQVVKNRRRNDPERSAGFGTRRGERSRTITLRDGAGLFIEEIGPAESRKGIVFIHGSVLRTDAWHYQMTDLGGFRSIYYDLRGHGLSQPKGDAEFSIETMSQDLLEVADDCGLEEIVVVGHSIGGMIALETSVTNPGLLGDRVKGLVILNSTHRPGVETVFGGASLAKFERVTRRPFDFLAKRSNYIEELRRIVRPSDSAFLAISALSFGPGASAKQIDFVYDMLADTGMDVIFDLIKSYRTFDVTDHLASITVPVALVAGTHDRLTIPSASEHLAEHLPKAELHMMEGCGHMSMLERYEEVNGIITRFARDVLGAP